MKGMLQKASQADQAMEMDLQKAERGWEGVKEVSPRRQILFWLEENPCRRRPDPFL
jgi:hypothetical protein